MAAIMIRPDMRTAGGESNDIMLDGRFVGSMTLVYRQSERIAGSVQLEEDSLEDEELAEVIDYVGLYIQGLIDAVGADECEVVVTHSRYEEFISTLDDANEQVEEEMPIDRPCDYFELTVASESRNAIEYHIYDESGYFLAEAFVEMNGSDMFGVVDWMFDPLDEEMDGVAHLLDADFEEDDYESFVIDMRFEGDIVETIELTREDLLEEPADEDEPLYMSSDGADYSLEIARDDGDSLTYHIFQMSHGSLPIGTATIDLSHRQITGFIDFRNPGDAEDRIHIAKMLMDEIDKERDCDQLNVTMMCNNEVIEEILLETEPIH